jgi:two-component system response regulator (stage 0 sporulation protein A)
MDGLEVLSALEQASRPKVLVLSGFVRGNMAELAAAKGASYFMMKPCKLSAVIERVRQLGGAVSQEEDNRSPAGMHQSLESSVTSISTRSECRPISRAIVSAGSHRHDGGEHGGHQCRDQGAFTPRWPSVHTTASRVERAIRHASRWPGTGRYGDPAKIFGYPFPMPKATHQFEFIAMIADRLQLQRKEK